VKHVYLVNVPFIHETSIVLTLQQFIKTLNAYRKWIMNTYHFLSSLSSKL